MMVKRIASTLAAALLLSLAGCLDSRAPLRVRVDSALIASGRLSGPVSLLGAEDRLVAVFSDRETISLVVSEIPLGSGLPSSPPPARLVDKIDAAPPLSPSFGEHAAAMTPEGLSILYLDREKEDRTVLKLASQAADTRGWRLDILEPAGNPVALFARPGGGLDCIWASPQSMVLLPAKGPVRNLQDDFQFSGIGSSFARGDLYGFTVFDETSQRLLWYRLSGGTAASGWVDGAGPVQAISLRPGVRNAGLLAVASYDPARRRIILREQNSNDGFTGTTVTICDGTRMLFLSPWGRGYLFLYDERRALGGGREASELSLLAMAGPRYHKKVLSSGGEPLSSMAALLRGDVLEVLVLRGDELRLLRVALPSSAAIP